VSVFEFYFRMQTGQTDIETDKHDRTHYQLRRRMVVIINNDKYCYLMCNDVCFFQSVNPYIVKLSILDDELALTVGSFCISFASSQLHTALFYYLF